MAQELSKNTEGVVRYVVVYDDVVSSTLVPMSANDSNEIHVSLVFVSLYCGQGQFE